MHSTLAGLAVLALALISPCTSHSWIEEYQVIDSNGSYIGDRGFSRGYVARTNVTGGFNGFSMDWLVPQEGVRINTSDSLCHPSQRTSNYSNPLYPKLNVAPGDYVAMKYLENGHVTLPWNQAGKPQAGGTVFVYGTMQPSDDEKMVDVLRWTSDGSGGNGKGWLMTAQNFDDGRCHQINCGNISTDRQLMFPNHVEGQPDSTTEQWCETDLQIPANQTSGTLTIYWVWQWPTASTSDCGEPEGKDEYYTTCADFDIIDNGESEAQSDAAIAADPAVHTLEQESPQSTAVSDFKSRTAYTTSPPLIYMSGTKTVGPTTSASSAFMSSCSAGLVTPMALKVDVPASCDAISVFSGPAVSAAFASAARFATTTELAAQPTQPAAPTTSSASSSSPQRTVTSYITVYSVTSTPTSQPATTLAEPSAPHTVTVEETILSTTTVTHTRTIDTTISAATGTSASSGSSASAPSAATAEPVSTTSPSSSAAGLTSTTTTVLPILASTPPYSNTTLPIVQSSTPLPQAAAIAIPNDALTGNTHVASEEAAIKMKAVRRHMNGHVKREHARHFAAADERLRRRVPRG